MLWNWILFSRFLANLSSNLLALFRMRYVMFQSVILVHFRSYYYIDPPRTCTAVTSSPPSLDQAASQLVNILCLVLFETIKIFCLPNMKSASDEEVEKLFEEFSRRISIFVYKVESAGRDFENKNRDESKSFQKLFKFRIH